MPTIITVGNQKGGVGKTTTAVNLAAAYAKLGKNVLLIDLDPQGDASKYLDHKRDRFPYVFDLLRHYTADSDPIDFSQAVRKNRDEKLSYIPTDARLDMADAIIADAPFREAVLKGILEDSSFEDYDYLFLDLSSRFSSLMINALAVSNFVVIPVQPQEWSYDGINKMIANINAVKKAANPRLEVLGILMTMCNRTVLSKSVAQAVREKYPQYALKVEIPLLVEVPESQNARRSLVNTSFSKTGRLYTQCARELIQREMEFKAKSLGIVIS